MFWEQIKFVKSVFLASINWRTQQKIRPPPGTIDVYFNTYEYREQMLLPIILNKTLQEIWVTTYRGVHSFVDTLYLFSQVNFKWILTLVKSHIHTKQKQHTPSPIMTTVLKLDIHFKFHKVYISTYRSILFQYF